MVVMYAYGSGTNPRLTSLEQVLPKFKWAIFVLFSRMMRMNEKGSGKDTKKAKNRSQRKPTIIRHFPPRGISSCATLCMLLRVLLFATFTNWMLFADAFASNLVETSIGCMTELSTDEVIMNEEVKPPEESDFPKMHLAVLDGSDKPIEVTALSYDPTVKTIQIAFVNPYTTSEFNDDLQFVMEIEGPTEDSRAAEFVSGGSIGCENNKRVSNRLLDSQAVVVLQINDPTSKLRIRGGWATGHNAVRLLPDLLLEPGEAGSAVEKNEELIEDLEEEILEEKFHNTVKEKLLRKQEEEKLEKILNEDKSASESEDTSGDEEEESIEDLEEEIGEEEFRNTDKEKLLRRQDEEKLEKLLNGNEAAKSQQQEERALLEETKETKDGLHRKRKNLLEKPENTLEGLVDPSKRKKKLGLEIALNGRERGQEGTSGDARETKTIQEKLKDKQFDLDSVNSKKNSGGKKKNLHRLTDHTARHRKRRDLPENIGMYDHGTDDDLPSVEEPEAGNDDVLPDEGDLGDDDDDNGTKARKSWTNSVQEERFLDQFRHFLACAFFAASMGLFLAIFGKKRDKGRRDL